MKIVSFNVNSVRLRLHQIQALTKIHSPVIIGLQETKVQDHDYPIEKLESMGYKSIFAGQKTHYGVATLYTNEVKLLNQQIGWPNEIESEDDPQKRLIITDFELINGKNLRVINGYFPQGENRSHEIKFPAKLRFYENLFSYLQKFCSPEQNIIILGDFNISAQDCDIGIGEDNRKRWLRDGKTSFLPEERELWQQLLNFGLYDTFRTLYPDVTNIFSWFDYRSKGFDKTPKRGLRIDTLLATEPMNKKVIESGVMYDIRSMDKPSDHAPVWTEFKL